MTDPATIWAYLASEPLLWLTATLIAYILGDAAFQASGKRPLANPVLIAVTLLSVVLIATKTPYTTYFDGAKFVHFLLGPATVCLAVPLYSNIPALKRSALPMTIALIIGSLTAILSALALGHALGLPRETLLSLAPKSATAPVAMAIAENIGGSPTLTPVLVILTGITGAIIATPLLNLFGFKNPRARGFATGLASHGIGTARAFQVSEQAGAFASVAMGLNAIATAILVPLVLVFFS